MSEVASEEVVDSTLMPVKVLELNDLKSLKEFPEGGEDRMDEVRSVGFVPFGNLVLLVGC